MAGAKTEETEGVEGAVRKVVGAGVRAAGVVANTPLELCEVSRVPSWVCQLPRFATAGRATAPAIKRNVNVLFITCSFLRSLLVLNTVRDFCVSVKFTH